MSKRGYISRYLLILKKLRTKPYSTYNELQSYIESQLTYLQMQDDSLNMGFSKRTLQRDIKEIRNIFGIDITYSDKQKGYFIEEGGAENMNFQRMVDAFDVFSSIKLAQDLTPFIQFEKRRPKGIENLYGLLHAIKNKLHIQFQYQKFDEDEPTLRTAEPYGLKEFENRWYVIVKDNKDDSVKSFALDRLTELEILKKKFKLTEPYNIEASYRYCFGIISANGKAPQEIILSFDPYQGKYIKSLPLHETQEIILDNKEELRIKLKMCITLDFMMEILSFGDNVKALKPVSLMDEIRKLHEAAYKQYL